MLKDSSVAAWGKWDEDGYATNTRPFFHRLENHCADVAACFELLMEGPVLHSRFEQAIGNGSLDPVTVQRLTVIVFLHDLGKLNAGFQFKVRDHDELPGAPRKRGHINETLNLLKQREICDAVGLRKIANSWGGAGFEALFSAALSHHGRPIAVDAYDNTSCPPQIWKPFNGYSPRDAAALIQDRIRTWFPKAFEEGPMLPESPPFVHLFAGVAALADQIGSDREYFPYEDEADPNYINRARERAKTILNARGLRRVEKHAQSKPANFQEMFGHQNPRPLQSQVMEAPLDHPLLILESETGSGKTEAAVMRFASLWEAGLVDGLYFALPTRAAAVQIHERVDRALRKFFPKEDIEIETVRAIPGYPFTGEARGAYNPEDRFEVFWEDHPDERVRAARWSAEAGRNFLSSIAAVGTIDQALLAGLKVKWAHLRGASLARSLLVVDEVHASDAYMTMLLHRILWDHLDLGGHALLMSATLGASARVRLCAPNNRIEPPEPDEAEAAPYPALTMVPKGAINGTSESAPSILPIRSLGRTKSVHMTVEPCLGDASKIAKMACEKAREGARVLLIRNTVTTAQDTFKELLNMGGGDLALTVNDIPTLHHSRFAVEDRQLLDQAVERLLGKEGVRDGGRVVIGTQTLEQSLDIDADLLITDPCPADVLLQRIGRLHRHSETQRAEPFKVPHCIVLSPENDSRWEDGLNGDLMHHGLGMSRQGGGIYRSLLTIRQTLTLASNHPTWEIPAMNRMLVERATHPTVLYDLAEELGEEWLEDWQNLWGVEAAQKGIARNHGLDRSRPFNESLFLGDLDEKVRTRLGEDGPRISLSSPVAGPFAQNVQKFNLPAYLCKSATSDDIVQAHAKPAEGHVMLQVGNLGLRYDQVGIVRMKQNG